MDDLLADLQARDDRDTHRLIAPLVPAEGAHVLDTSDKTVLEAVELVMQWWRRSKPSRGCLVLDGGNVVPILRVST